MKQVNRLSAILVFVLIQMAGGAQGATIEEFLTPTADSSPTDLAFDADGNLWFTEIAGNRIGKLDPAKAKAGTSEGIVEFVLPEENSQPNHIIVARNGMVWFTEMAGNKIGRLDPADGKITEYPIPTETSEPHQLVETPDGMIWFLEFEANKVGRLNPESGVIREFPVGEGHPHGLALVGDRLWYTQGGKFWQHQFANKLGSLDTITGKVSEIVVPPEDTVPHAILATGDGKLLFTRLFGQKVSSFNPEQGAGSIQNYHLLGEKRNPHSLAYDAGKRWVWIAQIRNDSIGRLDLNRAQPGTSRGVEEFKIPTRGAHPSELALDQEGNVWFTEMGHYFRGHYQNKIGKLTP